LKFTRISSNFNLRRRHPVLNRIRAHRGVDYAAPTGTPVKATGSGVVTFVGTKGGYGKTIMLRHGGVYGTLYAHLSKYAAGLKRGDRVGQGTTIGYVGTTGLATGPHLHYEFQVNGIHRNPLTVPLPRADGIPREQLYRFQAEAAPLFAELDGQLLEGEKDKVLAMSGESGAAPAR
jgi:murein DD-endopeptidase MepM/ murein hydrolase activator NlpD